MPDHLSAKELANEFGSFFHDKIQKIRDKLDKIHLPQPSVDVPEFCYSSFTEFKPVTQETVRKVICESATKSCNLDPIPTWLLKDSLDVLLPFITDIINSSLLSGTVPAAFKTSHIMPLLKKSNLDHNNLQNYRPIANLMFVFKVLERVVAAQLKTCKAVIFSPPHSLLITVITLLKQPFCVCRMTYLWLLTRARKQFSSS